eukprot:902961-Pleurochrysis_carterae.AAC.1
MCALDKCVRTHSPSLHALSSDARRRADGDHRPLQLGAGRVGAAQAQEPQVQDAAVDRGERRFDARSRMLD